MHETSPRFTPAGVAWLGYGGLLPFVVLALAAIFDAARASLWVPALVGYGAVILSFVGALHWGFAMTVAEPGERERTAWYAWSVAPALLAWLALLIPHAAAGTVLVAGFVTHYWRDTRVAKTAKLPGWYLPLRMRLTVVACLCLIAGALAPHA